MRTPAIVLNICLVIWMGYLLMKHGMPNHGVEFVLLFFALAAPIVSTVAIWNTSGEDWISLYFRRKALEERQKIEQLNAGRKP